MFPIKLSKEQINISKRIPETDDTDKEIQKSLFLNFRETESTVPTLKGILHKLKDVSGFSGSLESWRRIIQGTGFQWRKMQSKRKVPT